MPDAMQWHITLCFPMFLKLSGEPVAIRSFDASIEGTGNGDVYVFRTHKVWAARPGSDSFTIKLPLTVLSHNIAGMVPQPFDKA